MKTGAIQEKKGKMSSGQKGPSANRKKAAESASSGQWGTCDSCENEDVLVPEVGLCGPCCFGEAATAGGNW